MGYCSLVHVHTHNGHRHSMSACGASCTVSVWCIMHCQRVVHHALSACGASCTVSVWRIMHHHHALSACGAVSRVTKNIRTSNMMSPVDLHNHVHNVCHLSTGCDKILISDKLHQPCLASDSCSAPSMEN